jgi:hypothetical protein
MFGVRKTDTNRLINKEDVGFLVPRVRVESSAIGGVYSTRTYATHIMMRESP